ncbi:hypothetical protein SO802_006691 [Lithocarpus litseifolius]|uniref:Uncharacterized protein n=1 Tax=Lithocarpus litseifolius TaxID=425828 RepID=A0AAW2DLR2_9ROSI
MILMIVTSSRSNINIRHLEKATVSTGKEGLLSEGNAAYNWSRCVDELESQLSKHGSLKKLYFYHQHLTAVFRNTMFGPKGRPQHCCAWLGVASSFPECASPIVPEEIKFSPSHSHASLIFIFWGARLSISLPITSPKPQKK